MATIKLALIMLPRQRLTDFERGQASAWLQDHVSKREVVRRLGVSHSVMWKLNQRFLTTRRVQERHRYGPSKKMTTRENRFIHRQPSQTRTASSSTIRRQLRAATNMNTNRQNHQEPPACNEPPFLSPSSTTTPDARTQNGTPHIL